MRKFEIRHQQIPHELSQGFFVSELDLWVSRDNDTFHLLNMCKFISKPSLFWDDTIASCQLHGPLFLVRGLALFRADALLFVID